MADAVDDPRFVGGHPMAGSEQLGVDGARDDLFEGAVWTLTPVAHTSDEAFETVRSVVGSLGAEVAHPRSRASTTRWWPWCRTSRTSPRPR